MSVAVWLRRALLSALFAATLATPAQSIVNPGQAAPAFTKNVLGSTPWPTATLSQFAGKVVILYILGYS